MKLSRIGRVSMALVVSVAMGLGMTACGGGTIGFMWVLGTQYNQIAAFKIDDFTGNLTTPPGSPFSSGGSNPVALVVKPGGRYLYVINKGGGATSSASGSLPCGTGGGITEFAIGGQGVLTFQQSFQSQGCDSGVGYPRQYRQLPVRLRPGMRRGAVCQRYRRIDVRRPAMGTSRCSRLTRTRGGCRWC